MPRDPTDMPEMLVAEWQRVKRFILVGIVNTIVGYGVYYLALQQTGSINVAVAIATVVGYCFNFFTTGRFVFDQISLSFFPRFIAAAVLVYICNILLLDQLIREGMGAEFAQLICLPLVIVANYLLMRFVVF